MLNSVLASDVLITEDFSANPLGRGWKIFGDTNRFAWDQDRQRLGINWDSAFPNSYFYWPLDNILGKSDDFQLCFDLELDEITPGTSAEKPFAFEIAIGLINLNHALQPQFRRGTGTGSPNVVELDYFPDTGYGATLWPAFIATNGSLNYNSDEDYTLMEWPLHTPLRVVMDYQASTHTLSTALTQDGQTFTPVNPVQLSRRFTDYRVNAFSINCYSDAGASGSIRARGYIDNLQIRIPARPVDRIVGRIQQGQWISSCQSRSNWIYILERSANLLSWDEIMRTNCTADGPLMMPDNRMHPVKGYYRVRAEKP